MNCDQTATSMLSVEQALEKINSSTQAIAETEQCDLLAAQGRILAEDIHSSINVPPTDNSAMDGYAFRHQDLSAGQALKMIGKSFAGKPFTGQVNQGECVRIMTGATVPSGADTVEMQENVDAVENQISILSSPKKGNSIRKCGEDIMQGKLILSAGQALRAIDIGILASLGISSVKVYRKLKVAVFSTGDELCPPGTTAKASQIYDSNRYAIISMLSQAYLEVVDLGLIEDSADKIKQAFLIADQDTDIVISSGGVSVGEADYTRQVLEEIGNINFWKLAIKPGKPLAFGKLNSAFFFGLPGNPVSAVVTLQQIAMPALSQMSGMRDKSTDLLSAIAAEPFIKRPGRLDFQRAIYWQESGKLLVKPTGPQGSGMLTSVLNANCYAVLKREQGNVKEGETVDIQVFGL